MLKEQKTLSSVLNTGEVIRYFVGHNFTMNYDSYTGIIAHNYYLYEENGMLSMATWDYNDGFGLLIGVLHPELTMTDIVNWGIDTPLCDVELSQRPMWAWIVENDDYLQEYHVAMGELLGKNYRIQRQLDGALSADTMAQEAEAKVDASDVVISH